MLQPQKRIHQPPNRREDKKTKKQDAAGKLVTIKRLEKDDRTVDDKAKEKDLEEQQTAAAAKKLEISAMHRNAQVRTVICFCGAPVDTYPRLDLGADAPVYVLGLCRFHADDDAS